MGHPRPYVMAYSAFAFITLGLLALLGEAVSSAAAGFEANLAFHATLLAIPSLLFGCGGGPDGDLCNTVSDCCPYMQPCVLCCVYNPNWGHSCDDIPSESDMAKGIICLDTVNDNEAKLNNDTRVEAAASNSSRDD